MTNIAQAVKILKSGGLVAFPTETVYGLGGDAQNEQAIRAIFQAKKRPYQHPLIVHLAQAEQLSQWARDIPAAAWRLAEAFWPGPLTLVLKKQAHILDVLTAGQETIGLRIPNHPMALELLQAFNGGIAAPSANQFTHISPTTAAAVAEELSGRVDLILDGGDCAVGLESTIVDLSTDQPKILRPGMITPAMLAGVLGQPITHATTEVRVPGQHLVHYAPATATTLLSYAALADFLVHLTPEDLPVACLVYSEKAAQLPIANEDITLWWLPAQAALYAHDLYDTLRLLDHQQAKHILIEQVPDDAEWDAIRDRLFKASTKR